MINVDDRLIREELKVIGVDAFAVLMCITTHLGKSSTAWPGVARLRELTGLSKERTYNAIKRLIESGMVERWQENENGVWGKVVYRVTTQYLNIYVSASQFALAEEPLAGKPEHGYPEYGKPETGNPAHISINKEEVINNKEVINKEEESAPATILEPNPEQPTNTPPPDSAPPPSTELPPEELRIRTALTAAREWFNDWPAMRGVLLEQARLREHDVDFDGELEKWVRYHGTEFHFLSNITKNISGSFGRWISNTKQFNRNARPGKRIQGSAPERKKVEPGVAERVVEQGKRRGITVLT